MPSVDATFRLVRERHERINRDALRFVLEAQASDVRARFDAGARVLLTALWDRRVADVVFDRNKDAASEVGRLTAERFDARAERRFDPDLMDDWLEEVAELTAGDVNAATRAALEGIDDLDAIDGVLGDLLGFRLDTLASGMVTTAANFGAHDGARAAGAAVKVWQVNSGAPRQSHSGLDGVTVGIDDVFPNGMRWPGDPSGGAEELANCMCSLGFAA